MQNEYANAGWPGWEVVRLIGRGSFGAVYEIRRELLGNEERAALKVITIPQSSGDIEEMYGEGYDDESITATFHEHLKSIINEYSLMRKMNGSSNVVSCDDVRYIQHEDGFGWDIYIKMELLTPLTKALPQRIPEETALRVGVDLCHALELCKKHGIIHRDIKPQNIFMSENGDYKLGDFGIAKTVEKTMGGTKVGTYKYMAPEVYNNRPYGGAADIYSLGMVLYWLLNERRMPFTPLPPAKPAVGADELARTRRLSGEPLPAPRNGSEALKAIVLKACAYAPEDRYADPAQMRQELETLLYGQAAPINAPVREDRTASLEERKARMTETYGESTVGAGYAYQSAPVPQPAPAPEPAEEESTVGAGYAYRSAPVPEPVEEESTVGVGYAPRPAPQPEPRPVSLQMEAENTVRGEKAAPEPEPAPEGKQKFKKLAIVAAVLVVVILAVAVPWKELLFGLPETVYFGRYEQDNNFFNGEEPIEWLVLEVKDGRALLLSKYALDCACYAHSDSKVDWEESYLRYWLNELFPYLAFDGKELAAISTTVNKNMVEDKVFILSWVEAATYFSSDEARKCSPTAYAKAMGITQNKYNKKSPWWLRSPGSRELSIGRNMYVDVYGAIAEYGEEYDVYYGVRPAIWVDVNALWLW